MKYTIFSSKRHRIFSILRFFLNQFALFTSSKALSVEHFPFYMFVFLPKAHEKQELRKTQNNFSKEA